MEILIPSESAQMQKIPFFAASLSKEKASMLNVAHNQGMNWSPTSNQNTNQQNLSSHKFGKGTATGINITANTLETYVHPTQKFTPEEVNSMRKKLRIVLIADDK